jgi:hypothetical protein
MDIMGHLAAERVEREYNWKDVTVSVINLLSAKAR